MTPAQLHALITSSGAALLSELGLKADAAQLARDAAEDELRRFGVPFRSVVVPTPMLQAPPECEDPNVVEGLHALDRAGRL